MQSYILKILNLYTIHEYYIKYPEFSVGLT